MPQAFISTITRRVWKAVSRRPDWKVAAFVAHCSDRGVPMDKAVVSKMLNGKRRTDAETLWMLAEYFDDAQFVYGPYMAMLEADDADDGDDAADFDALEAHRELVVLSGAVLTAGAAGDHERVATLASAAVNLANQIKDHADRGAC